MFEMHVKIQEKDLQKKEITFQEVRFLKPSRLNQRLCP